MSLIVLLGLAGYAPAQQGEESLATPLKFRRVYVPADMSADHWPTEKRQYIHVPGKDFEEQVRLLETASGGGPGPIAARITKATYAARLVGEDLVGGTAEFVIDRNKTTPVQLPLEPCNVAIANPRWKDKPATRAWIGLDPNGRTAALVDQPGPLVFDWSLHGRRGLTESLSFSLALPRSPANSLQLDLPAAVMPITSAGMLDGPRPSNLPGYRAWQVVLGGATEFDIKIIPGDTPGATAALTLVRESFTYDMSLRGVELSARFDLETVRGSLSRLEFLLDPEIRLIAARENDVPLYWSDISASEPAPPAAGGAGPGPRPLGNPPPAAGDPPAAGEKPGGAAKPPAKPAAPVKPAPGAPPAPAASPAPAAPANTPPAAEAHGEQRRIVLTLPESTASTRIVSVRAFLPLVTDRAWRLPTIRPQGVFWQEGKATLRVVAPLALEQMKPLLIGDQMTCRQIEASPLPSPSVGESYVVEHYSDAAQLDVRLAWRERAPRLKVGSTLVWNADQISGQSIFDFTLEEGKRFTLEGVVPGRWLIDSLTSIPVDALGDWRVVPRAGTAPRIEINLTHALSSTQPLRLIVKGRLLRPPLGEPLALANLQLLEFAQAEEVDHRMAIRAATPFRLEMLGGERVRRLAMSGLDATWINRFSERSPDLLFMLDAEGADATVSLERQRPRFTAELDVEVTASDSGLWETVEMRCQPEAGAEIDRLEVLVTPKQAEPFDWSLFQAPAGSRLVATRLPDDDKREDRPVGERWALTIQPPSARPVTFRGQRGRAVNSPETRLGLVSLPQAASQQGLLLVRTYGRASLELVNQGLTVVPVPDSPADPAGWNRAAFRFESSTSRDTSQSGYVLLRRRGGPAEPSAMIWRAELESRYEGNGQSQHWLTYRVQNLGFARLDVTLPPATELSGAWVGTQRLPQNPSGGMLSIELPIEERFVTIRLVYQTRAAAWSAFAMVRPQFPTVDIPVLDHRWTVLLPPAYRAAVRPPGWDSPQWPAPSWTERVFGVFGRPAGGARFDPWKWSDWSRLVGDDQLLSQGQERGQIFIDRLNLQVGDDDARAKTFGELFLSAADSGAAEAAPVWIDRESLAKAGVVPKAFVVWPTSITDAMPQSTAKSKTFFDAWKLAIVIDKTRLIVTTQATVDRFRDRVTPLAGGRLFAAHSGPAIAPLSTTGVRDDLPATLPLASWNFEPSWVWLAGDRQLPAGSQLETPDPWSGQIYELNATTGALSPLPLVHQSTLDTWIWAAFFLLLPIGHYVLRRKPKSLLLAIALFAAAALIAPAGWSELGSAAIAGLLMGFMWAEWTTSPPPVAVPDSKSKLRGSTAAMAVRLTICGLVAGAGWYLGGRLFAQEPAAADAYDESIVYPIIIQLPPEGDDPEVEQEEHYFVPREFNRELKRRTEKLEAQPERWLWCGATYRGTLSWESDVRRYSLPQLAATFEVWTSSETVAFLPLSATGLSVLPETATLDGRPVALVWDGQRKGFLVPVAAAGQYRLEITLVPQVRTHEFGSGVSLSIPPLVHSRLELRIGSESPLVEAPSIIGATEFDAGSQSLRGELGPASELSIVWRDDDPVGRQTPRLKVEQFMWLKVMPGSAVVDVRLKCHVVDGAVRQLYFAADPRYELLKPWQAPQLRARQIRELPGSLRTHILHFGRPLTGDFVVETSFLLKGTSGVGNLRLPRLEAVGVDLQKQWLALSVDRSLEVVEADGPEVQLAAFASAWEMMELKPAVQKVFDLKGVDLQLWRIATRPREPVKTAEQDLSLVVGLRRIDVEYQVDLMVSEAPSFQHQIRVPPNLEVSEVLQTEFSAQRRLRFSRASADTLTVFLAAPTSGSQQIIVRGRLPIVAPGRVALPVMRLEQARITQTRLHLYRHADVLFDLEQVGGLEAEETADASLPSLPNTRLVQSLATPPTSRGDEYEGWLAILPNQPHIQAAQASTLSRAADRWQLAVELDLVSIRDGVVDMLALEVPAAWQGPFEISPPMAHELVELPGIKERLLVVRPYRSLSGPARISIRGPITMQAGERVRLPVVEPRNIQELRRYVVLPTHFDLKEAAWETFGLQPTELPADFQSAPPRSFAALEVVSRPYGAALRSFDQTSRLPRIWLADVVLRLSPQGEASGVATFDIDPAGLAECQLRLPANLRPVLMQIDGRPARAVALEDDRWRIDLAPTQYPHLLEVVFTGRIDPPLWGQDQRTIVAPWIEQLTVERTCWTIHSVDGETGLAGGDPSLDPLQHAVFRLESLSQLLEQAQTSTAEEPDRETASFLAARVRRFELLSEWLGVQIQSRPKSEEAQTVAAELLAADTLLRDWSAKRRAPRATGAGHDPNPRWSAAQLWSNRLPTGDARYYSWRGSRRSVELRTVHAERLDLIRRGITALLLVVLALVFGPAVARIYRRRGQGRSRYVLAVFAGLAWWYFLEPSAIGWLIVIFSIAFAIRSWWPRREELRTAIQPVRRQATA